MASGDTLVSFHPYQNEPPSSNAATLDLRNQHPVLDFDASTNESAVFSAVMPQHYSATTGVTVFIHYSMSSATSPSDTDWDVSFERVGDEVQDTDSPGFATAVSGDGDVVPVTLGHVGIASVALTDGAQMDSVAVGEKFRIKITRDGVSDTSSGDAEVHYVEIQET